MIKNKEELQYFIRQDRLINGYPAKRKLKEVITTLFLPNVASFLRALRIFEYCLNVNNLETRIKRPYSAFHFHIISRRTGYYIGANVCGPGLSLPHYGPIIISADASIGCNCRIHTCVNIGRSGGGKKAPLIGDNVYIGPSSVLFGDIQIANNVTIGANATVNKSITEENVVIAGSPAVIVKRGYPNWLEFNKE